MNQLYNFKYLLGQIFDHTADNDKLATECQLVACMDKGKLGGAYNGK